MSGARRRADGGPTGAAPGIRSAAEARVQGVREEAATSFRGAPTSAGLRDVWKDPDVGHALHVYERVTRGASGSDQITRLILAAAILAHAVIWRAC